LLDQSETTIDRFSGKVSEYLAPVVTSNAIDPSLLSEPMTLSIWAIGQLTQSSHTRRFTSSAL
jgi:hypothetical protein